jgi:hypothetical protein
MYNLFSITQLQGDGWTLHGNAESIWLTKKNATITFDIQISTAKGMLYVMYNQCGTKVANAGNQVNEMAKEVSTSIGKARDLSGHHSEELSRKSAEALGWTITQGTLGPCQSCTEAKVQNRKVSQGIRINHPLQEINKAYIWTLGRFSRPRKDPRSI